MSEENGSMDVESLIGKLYLRKGHLSALLRNLSYGQVPALSLPPYHRVLVCRLNAMLKRHGMKIKKETIYRLDRLESAPAPAKLSRRQP